MKFIDEATIEVKAGNGGNGCVAFRREAHVPRGGPSGGDGGDGGSVVLEADGQLSTLLDFKYRRHYKAPRGEDLILKVPVGTSVIDVESGDMVADLDQPGARFVAAQGGKGGLGNIHFSTAWNRVPRQATPGTAGEERILRLELKLLADVGLLGFPNVGKSTFIAAVSRARPKIADYPFTTLAPNLGVVRLSGDRTLIVADIPGLIEGASDGAGLGHRFLKHVERTRVLLHILDASPLAGPDREPLADFDLLNRELARYAPDLAERPQIVVLGKVDITETRDQVEELRKKFEQRGIQLFTMSAATREGTDEVLEALWRAAHPSPS